MANEDSLSVNSSLLGTKERLTRSEQDREPYEISILGKQFLVHPEVFSPKYFRDTVFFAENLPYEAGKSFLEIGSGIGALSIFAALQSMSPVVTTDINPKAVLNTKENVRIYGLDDKVNVLQGDVYSPLGKEQRFDKIFWNVPFCYVEKEDFTDLERSVFNPFYRSLKTYISGARAHLAPEGTLLIGFSTTLGRYDLLQSFLQENNFQVKCLAQTLCSNAHDRGSATFELFEAK